MNEENKGRYDPVETRKRVGFLVWWSLGPCAYDSVNRALREAGVKPQGFVKRPPGVLCLKRACALVDKKLVTEAKEGLADGAAFHRVEPVVLERHKAEFAVVEYERVEKGSGRDVVATVSAGKGTGFQPDGEHAVVDRIRAEFDRERGVCVGEKISRALVEVAEKQGRGTLLRPGLYYLPWHGQPDYNPGLSALRGITAKLDGCVLYEVVVYDEKHTVRSVAPAAEATLLGNVASLERLVNRWTGFKKKALSDANHKQLNPLRKKIEMYERRLGVELKHVKRRCDEVAELMDEKRDKRVTKRAPRPRLDEEPEAEPLSPLEEGLTLKQRQVLALARDGIRGAVERDDPYLRSLVDVALAGVAKDCGVELANLLIEEFDLFVRCGARPLEGREP